MFGKCPKCAVDCEYVEIRVKLQAKWKGVQYLCPSCKPILSVQIDSVALMTDTVKQVVDALGRT